MEIESMEIRRKVGDWTAKLELVRKINRHHDRTYVDSVELHVEAKESAGTVARRLRDAAKTFAVAADKLMELADEDVRPDPATRRARGDGEVGEE